MRRTSRWILLGVLFATSATGVSVPVPPVEADERPPLVQLQPRGCVELPSSIQQPLVCAATCPGFSGCGLTMCARSDCGTLWCFYDCT